MVLFHNEIGMSPFELMLIGSTRNPREDNDQMYVNDYLAVWSVLEKLRQIRLSLCCLVTICCIVNVAHKVCSILSNVLHVEWKSISKA